MSINFPINITHIKQFYVFLLILSNFLVASSAKTKNHSLGSGPWVDSLKKEMV